MGGIYHAESMTTNSLGIFYTVPDRWQLYRSGKVHISWKCDPDAVIEIGKAGDLDLAGLCRSNLAEVNTYFDRQISTNPELITLVIDNLYRIALTPAQPLRHNCWFNFIAAMTAKAAAHIWGKIPASQQSEELFERLITPTLSVRDLLTGFNPQYQPNLLIGLHAWTYKVVRYNSYAEIRANGDPYFGLSNFGVVSRSSYKTMRVALAGNIIPTRLDLYISICKVFKSYLAETKIAVNKLELVHWHEIVIELKSMEINISVDELCGWIDRVGNLIRIEASPSIDPLDDRNNSTIINDLAARTDNYSDRYLDEPHQLFGLLDTIIDEFVIRLSPEDRQVLIWRHHRKLKQREIGELLAINRYSAADWTQLSQVEIDKLIHNYGSNACKKLHKFYSDLLVCIYSRISHPEDRKGTKNSLSIDAIKQLLDKYFSQKPFSDFT